MGDAQPVEQRLMVERARAASKMSWGRLVAASQRPAAAGARLRRCGSASARDTTTASDGDALGRMRRAGLDDDLLGAGVSCRRPQPLPRFVRLLFLRGLA